MNGPGVEDGIPVLGGPLLTIMVAELAGPTAHLRGTELAQAISHAASVAGGEVSKEQPGLSAGANELAIAAITTATCAVVNKAAVEENVTGVHSLMLTDPDQKLRRRLRAHGAEGEGGRDLQMGPMRPERPEDRQNAAHGESCFARVPNHPEIR